MAHFSNLISAAPTVNFHQICAGTIGWWTVVDRLVSPNGNKQFGEALEMV
ncbi:hypothetical protein CsSME_00000584 [Camellia sinensis var. sinensis]